MTRLESLLLTGALGDSIGNDVESGNFRLSDDTQLTFATCEAIATTGSICPEAIADEFRRWFQNGHLVGLGSATLEALRGLSAGGHWALVGRGGEYAAGNGAAMRIAPLGLLLDPTASTDRRTIRDVARITHRNDEAATAALAVVAAVYYQLSHGAWDRLWQVVDVLPDSVVRDRLMAIHMARPTVDDLQRFVGDTGWAADTVPHALAAVVLRGRTPVRDWLYQLAGASRDPDTLCSTAGQVAGSTLDLQQLGDLSDLTCQTYVTDLSSRVQHAVGLNRTWIVGDNES